MNLVNIDMSYSESATGKSRTLWVSIGANALNFSMDSMKLTPTQRSLDFSWDMTFPKFSKRYRRNVRVSYSHEKE